MFGPRVRQPTNLWAGPWQADRALAERWAAWFRSLGQDAQVQSNQQSGAVMRERGAAGR